MVLIRSVVSHEFRKSCWSKDGSTSKEYSVQGDSDGHKSLVRHGYVTYLLHMSSDISMNEILQNKPGLGITQPLHFSLTTSSFKSAW